MQRSQKGRYDTGNHKSDNQQHQQQGDSVPSRPRFDSDVNPAHASRPINTSSILALQEKLKNVPHAIRYQKAQRKFRMNHSKRPFPHTEVPKPFKRQRATELIERNNQSTVSATDAATFSAAGRNWKTQIKKRGQPFYPKKITTDLSSKQQQPHPALRRRSSSQSWTHDTTNSSQPSNNYKNKPLSGTTQSNERDKNKAPPISSIRLEKNIPVAQDNMSPREINLVSSTTKQQRQSGFEKVTIQHGRNDSQSRAASQNMSKENLNQISIRKHQTNTSTFEDTQTLLKQEATLLKLIEKQIQLQIALDRKATSKPESTKQQKVISKPNTTKNVAASNPTTTSIAVQILPSDHDNDSNNNNMSNEKSCHRDTLEKSIPINTNKKAPSSIIAISNKEDRFIYAKKKVSNEVTTDTEKEISGLKNFEDIMEMMNNFYGPTILDDHEHFFNPNPNSLQCKNFLTPDGIVLVLVQPPHEYRQLFWPARVASAIESDRWRSHYLSSGVKVPEEKICIILYFPHTYYLNIESKNTNTHPGVLENWWQVDFVSKSNIFPFKVQTSGMENLSTHTLSRFHRGQSIAAGLRKWAIDNDLKIPETKDQEKDKGRNGVHNLVANYDKEFEFITDNHWITSSLKDHNEVAKMIKSELTRSRKPIEKKAIAQNSNSNLLGDNATKIINGTITAMDKASIAQNKSATKNTLNTLASNKTLENNNDSNHKSHKSTMDMDRTNATLDQLSIAHDCNKGKSKSKTQSSTKTTRQKPKSSITGSNRTTIQSGASKKNDIVNKLQHEDEENNTSCYQVSNGGNNVAATINCRTNRTGGVPGSKSYCAQSSTSQSAQVDSIDDEQQTWDRMKNFLIAKKKESKYHNTKQMYSDLLEKIGNIHQCMDATTLLDIMTAMSMRITTLESEKDLLSRCMEEQLSTTE